MGNVRRNLVVFVFLSQLFFVLVGEASWAFRFVVYDGNVYVITDEVVDPSKIGVSLGEVTYYTDREGTYGGNFSNTFPVGTPYLQIHGVDVLDFIAIKLNEDQYIKAIYNGEYAGKNAPIPTPEPPESTSGMAIDAGT